MSVHFEKGVSLKPVDLLSESFELLKPNIVMVAVAALIAAFLYNTVILAGAAICGMFYLINKQFNTSKSELGDLFRGFDFFVESLITGLIAMAAFTVVLLPITGVYMIATFVVGDIAILMGLSSLVFITVICIASIALYLVFTFPFILIMEYKMKALDAIKLSFEAVKANLVPLLILMVLCLILSSVAALFCILPYFIAAPVCMGAFLLAYRQIFPARQSFDVVSQAAPVAPESSEGQS